MHVLAQDAGYGSAILWSAIIIGLCLAMFFVLSAVRKKLRDDADASGPSTGFTLADLRELHRNGKMTDEEFEKAKATLVDAIKKAASKPAPAGRADVSDARPDRYDPPPVA